MTARELERRAKHKLAVIKHVVGVSGSVLATCRYYGISRNCYYKWLKRYEEEGFEGLKDRSSAPAQLTESNQVRCRARRRRACDVVPAPGGAAPGPIAAAHQCQRQIRHCLRRLSRHGRGTAGGVRLPVDQRAGQHEALGRYLRAVLDKPPADRAA
jgi:transposase